MPFLPVALLAGYLFSPGFPSGGGFSKYFDKPAYLQQATGGLTPDIQHSQAKQLKLVCFCALSLCVLPCWQSPTWAAGRLRTSRCSTAASAASRT